MDCSAVQPPLSPPLHISNRCEIPQQHPLHVDTWLETKKKFLKILSFFGGTVPLSWIVSVTGNYGCPAGIEPVLCSFYMSIRHRYGDSRHPYSYTAGAVRRINDPALICCCAALRC